MTKWIIFYNFFFPLILFSQKKLEGRYNYDYQIFTTENIDSIYFVEKFRNGHGIFFNKKLLDARTNFDNNVEVFSGDKCGLINSNGEIILPLKYNKITIINDSVVRLRSDEADFLYNLKSKNIISKGYDVIAHFQNRKISEVSIGNLHGVININGEEILKTEYNSILPYFRNVIVVKKGNKSGCYNEQGKLLIPIEYKNIEIGQKYIYAKNNFGFEIFDKTGKFIRQLDYSRIKELANDFFAIEDNKRTYLYNITNNTKFDSLNFSDLGIDYFDRNNNKHLRAFEYQKYGIKMGFIDYNLNIILPIEYEIGNFKDGFATIGKNNLYGFIDESKQIVIPLKFDRVWSFFDGVAKAIFQGKNVYIDTEGKILFESDINPETMQESIGFFYEGYAIKIKNGKYGFVNKIGKEVIPLIYEKVYEFKDEAALVLKNREYYYINTSGEKIK